MLAAKQWLIILVMAGGLAAGPISAGAAADDSLAASIVKSARARGGLCIHIGCGDGSLTADLAQSGHYIVHGLSLRPGQVQAARRKIQAMNLYGVASVVHSSLTKLPYVDDLANLVVADDLLGVLESGCSLREIMRVLAPLGVAYVGSRADAKRPTPAAELRKILRKAGIEAFEIIETEGVWAKITKPRPKEMDEWTHARHSADRNPVANDALVRPPNSLRWIYGPRWRGTSGIQLSANGRNIYADGTVRDAFNGLRVYNLRSPGKYKYVTPRLAVGDRIYITAPRASKFLQAVDASSGKIVLTYEHVKTPSGLAYSDGDLLFANVDGAGCVNAETGKLKWMNDDLKVEGRLSHGASALVVAQRRVFVQTTRSRRSDEPARLACLDRETGHLLWQKSQPELQGELRLYSRGVVVCCDSYRVYPKRIYAYSAVDGRLLWKSPPMNEGKSVGVYAIDGLIWCQHNRQTIGLDAATGKVKRKHVAAPGTFKCSHPAATTRYISGGSLAFLDLSTGTIEARRLDRNGCGSDPGVLFCNGLTYSFPKQCSCFSMIRGYTAYAADGPLDESTRYGGRSNRLVKGPAFGDWVVDQQDSAGWPAFRHDGRRSANTNASVPLPIKKLWEAAPENQKTPKWLEEDWRNHPSLDGPVSSVVAGAGMLCLSLPNSHQVAALDPQTGRLRWSFTAGGRVLTPPTISGGRCFFGGQDGWAYCLRLRDGSLAWKFRAAPADRRILAHGQLESLWPVSGGVLVENGRAFFTAGRLSNLVGGLVGYAVDARSGKLIWRQTPPTGYEYARENKIAPAYRNDVPVSGPNVVQMGHPRWIVSAKTGQFAKDIAPLRHRYVKPRPVSILGSTRDGLWDRSRSKWQGPTDMGHGYLAQEFGDVWAQQLVIRDDRIFGFQLPTIKTYYYDKKQTQKRNPLRLVAWDRSFKELWSKPLAEGTEFVGMIGAGEVLFATGTQRLKERPYFKGMLWAYSTADGSELMRIELDGLPAGEGLVAAYGKLYVTMQDGRLLCLANDKR